MPRTGARDPLGGQCVMAALGTLATTCLRRLVEDPPERPQQHRNTSRPAGADAGCCSGGRGHQGRDSDHSIQVRTAHQRHLLRPERPRETSSHSALCLSADSTPGPQAHACADVGDRPHRPDRGHLRADLEEHALQDQARRARGARSATRDGPDRRRRAAVCRLLRHLCATQRVAAVQPDEAPSAWWVLGPPAVLGRRRRRQCVGSPRLRQGLLVGPGATPLLRVALPRHE